MTEVSGWGTSSAARAGRQLSVERPGGGDGPRHLAAGRGRAAGRWHAGLCGTCLCGDEARECQEPRGLCAASRSAGWSAGSRPPPAPAAVRAAAPRPARARARRRAAAAARAPTHLSRPQTAAHKRPPAHRAARASAAHGGADRRQPSSRPTRAASRAGKKRAEPLASKPSRQALLRRRGRSGTHRVQRLPFCGEGAGGRQVARRGAPRRRLPQLPAQRLQGLPAGEGAQVVGAAPHVVQARVQAVQARVDAVQAGQHCLQQLPLLLPLALCSSRAVVGCNQGLQRRTARRLAGRA